MSHESCSVLVFICLCHWPIYLHCVSRYFKEYPGILIHIYKTNKQIIPWQFKGIVQPETSFQTHKTFVHLRNHKIRYFWWNPRAFCPARSYHVQCPEGYQEHRQNSTTWHQWFDRNYMKLWEYCFCVLKWGITGTSNYVMLFEKCFHQWYSDNERSFGIIIQNFFSSLDFGPESSSCDKAWWISTTGNKCSASLFSWHHSSCFSSFALIERRLHVQAISSG